MKGVGLCLLSCAASFAHASVVETLLINGTHLSVNFNFMEIKAYVDADEITEIAKTNAEMGSELANYPVDNCFDGSTSTGMCHTDSGTDSSTNWIRVTYTVADGQQIRKIRIYNRLANCCKDRADGAELSLTHGSEVFSATMSGSPDTFDYAVTDLLPPPIVLTSGNCDLIMPESECKSTVITIDGTEASYYMPQDGTSWVAGCFRSSSTRLYYNSDLSSTRTCNTAQPCVCAGAPPTQSPTAGATQDPHITTIHGQRFNFHLSGRFNMLTLPSSDHNKRIHIVADMEALSAQPCSPTYIRTVDLSYDDKSWKIRCGAPNTFNPSSNENLEILSPENKAWTTHKDWISNTADPDFFVSAVIGDNCIDGAHCQEFIFHAPQMTARISQGQSSHRHFHYINLGIDKLNVSSGASGSGLLWGDNVKIDSCA